ncbi:SusC/RagA family TonB-linked outer membrane protein [Psychroflexus maritimus]|uniref:SusC/RagA family TonB-linked outer membrane protein n=1 Tax=Psychroflexus maritimus TaxID=2714865 RepID=A0A967ABN6_9FLAO|nr:SusC/RagA family TonB-linked outer membrane protein [Psychroflexus maritimus]NGZ88643.1 SusC/RagA family TonB-linked outer membrane protein [Psychroflexus maritimus]
MQTLKQLYLLFLCFPMFVLGQNTISGTVTDDNNIPVPGVEILVQNTTRGTTTDFDGNYSIDVNNGDVLLFKYLGYKTVQVEMDGQTTVDVNLEPDENVLEEVVLVGYGTSRKKDITGSVSSISREEMTKGNIVSPNDLLQGRAAGVNINNFGGAPGAPAQIRIRGGGSLGANNDPLIVLDGLPLEFNAPGGARSLLSSLNPNDIESFSVLKDASATAIYGNRASAGVIIIETKKGTKQFQVDYNYVAGVYTPFNQIDVFNANEFRSLIAERRPDDVSLLGDANTNWQEEIYSTALSSDHNISIRGTLLDRIPTRLSVGYLDQEGIRLTSSFERTNASLAMNPTFFQDHLRVNLNANVALERNRFADGVEGAAIRFDPTQPVRDPNSPFGGFFEHFVNDNGTPTPELTVRNPVASLLQRDNRTEVNRYYGNMNLDYRFHFLPEMRAVVNLGLDISESSGRNLLDPMSASGFNSENERVGSESIFDATRRNYLADGYLNYKKDLTSKLNGDFTLGYSYQRFEDDGFNIPNLRDPLFNERFDFANLDLVLVAFFGRAVFNYDDKYILTTTYRRDGSSRFSSENRWGDFFSGAFAWNIMEENFMENQTTFDNLKLRLGVGQTGQQEIGRRGIYLANYNIGREIDRSAYMFGTTPILPGLPSSRNERAQWETSTMYNAGIDYGFFNNRLYGSIDAYFRKTDDLFINAGVPDGANFANSFSQNNGTLETKGLELEIGATLFDNEGDSDKFNWNVNYNVTFMDQEITALANDEEIRVGGIAGGTGNTAQVHQVGNAPSAFYVFNQIYDADGMPIEGAYADLNGDGIITDDDRYAYRNPMPDVVMGFQSSMEYKNFDFSFNLRASIGNYNYNNVDSGRAQYNFLQDQSQLGNIPRSVLNTNFNVQENVILSDIYIEDASFLRMDNIQLGYTFKDVLSKGNNFRIWTGVQNAFVITNYSGLDPEIVGGIDNTIFPRPRTFLLGANINF